MSVELLPMSMKVVGLRIRRVLLLAGVFAAGCSIAVATSAADLGSGTATTYPIVTERPAPQMPPVTTPGGSSVSFPVNPTTYVVSPSTTCEREYATFHDGSKPAKRLIVIPPRPGLAAKAFSSRTVQLEWSFTNVPAACRPAALLLTIVANGDVRATPMTATVSFKGTHGTARLTYASFLSRPNVALARALMRDGRRSRPARVLIQR